jgi:hypothetical protein
LLSDQYVILLLHPEYVPYSRAHRKVTFAWGSLKVNAAEVTRVGFAGVEMMLGAAGGVTPVRLICWTEDVAFSALSVRLTVPVIVPAALVVGVNNTPTTH